MTFHIITIFPEAFESYFNISLLKKAREKGIVKINLIDLRDFAGNKHKKIDDKPFGGGPGMVMQVEPIYKAVESVKRGINGGKDDYAKNINFLNPSPERSNIRVVLFSVKGKKFDQKLAEKLSQCEHIIMICGHYEGVDERVAKYIADERISIGDFILSGGELPVMVAVDAISRLLPNFLGNPESIEHRRFGKSKEVISFSSYTRPEVFYPNPKNKKIVWRAPKVLLSGNHKEIEKWRKNKSR